MDTYGPRHTFALLSLAGSTIVLLNPPKSGTYALDRIITRQAFPRPPFEWAVHTGVGFPNFEFRIPNFPLIYASFIPILISGPFSPRRPP